MEPFEFPTQGLDFSSFFEHSIYQILSDQTGESLPAGLAKRENEKESDESCMGLSGGGSKFFGFQPPPDAAGHPGTFEQSEVSGVRLKRKVSESEFKKERKRAIDKNYREKLKNDREQMVQELDCLKKENASLRTENDALKEQNAQMNDTLQSQEGEIKQLRCSFIQLKRRCEKQDHLVEALSDQLSHSDSANPKNEHERLKIKQSSSASLSAQDHVCDLLDEISKLRRDKRLLEVKVDALCEKIDNDRKYEEEEQKEHLNVLL